MLWLFPPILVPLPHPWPKLRPCAASTLKYEYTENIDTVHSIWRRLLDISMPPTISFDILIQERAHFRHRFFFGFTPWPYRPRYKYCISISVRVYAYNRICLYQFIIYTFSTIFVYFTAKLLCQCNGNLQKKERELAHKTYIVYIYELAWLNTKVSNYHPSLHISYWKFPLLRITFFWAPYTLNERYSNYASFFQSNTRKISSIESFK